MLILSSKSHTNFGKCSWEMNLLVSISCCILFCLSITSIRTQSEYLSNWNYSNIDKLKECLGPSQSPINIPRTGKFKTNFTTLSEEKTFSGLPKIVLPPLEFQHYTVAPKSSQLKNTGFIIVSHSHNVQFSPQGHALELTITPFTPDVTPMITGGGLKHKYIFEKLIFHWGQISGEGQHQIFWKKSQMCWLCRFRAYKKLYILPHGGSACPLQRKFEEFCECIISTWLGCSLNCLCLLLCRFQDIIA